MEEIEKEIRTKLYLRGFSEKQVVNNRGLIGAVIEEMMLLNAIKELTNGKNG